MIQKHRLLLHCQLKQFCELQSSYIASVALMIELEEESLWQIPEATHPRVEVERQKLWLPSDLPPNHQEHRCHPKPAGIELKLQRAQCNNTLEKVRSLQRARLSMIAFHNCNVHRQAPNTWSIDSIRHVEDKCLAAALRYNAAQAALLALQGPGDQDKELRELRQAISWCLMALSSALRIRMTILGRMERGSRRNRRRTNNWG